jgi:HlyD family secretion protein
MAESMDKKLVKKRFTLKKVATYLGSAALVLFIAYQFIFADRRSTLKTDREKITISEVKMGEFKEYIPQTGTVEPARTVYLDAIEGGNIKHIYKESGAMLKAGDKIMDLTNLNRELAVLSQEAQLNESINRARETRLTISKNDLDQRQQLAQADNMIAILQPQYERQKKLYEKKLIAKQDFEKTEADYKYNVIRHKITYDAYRVDSLIRIGQLKDLTDQLNRMSINLEALGKILDNLSIKSPVDGQLTTSSYWDVGQAIAQGQRIGKVDVVGSYKVKVPIDELYLPKISVGLPASTDYAGKTYGLEITYVYPNVANGRFDVEMRFTGETPQGLRSGLSLRLRIELGQPSQELLLPMGGFYKDTGGNWVFIVEPGSNRAVKREVKLGRKMGSEYFEVLEGLKPGDQVVTSSYENFGNNEVLILN